MSTAQLVHQRLSKSKALAVFLRRPLVGLRHGGDPADTHPRRHRPPGASIPIALAIVALLAIVAISYRQTIRAYPNGGGAYIVAKENLGEGPAQVAAAALLVDYILTVSVSVAAGVAAIISALPETADWRVPMGVAAITIVTLLNLRGVRESATIFALPTYAFIFTAFALLVVGAIRVMTGNAEPVVHEERRRSGPRCSSSCALAPAAPPLPVWKRSPTACSAFKPPESRNAATTLTWMAVILGDLRLHAARQPVRPHPQPRARRSSPSWGGSSSARISPTISGRRPPRSSCCSPPTPPTPTSAARLALGEGQLHAPPVRLPRRPVGVLQRHHRAGAAAAGILAVYGGEVTRLIPLYAVGVSCPSPSRRAAWCGTGGGRASRAGSGAS
jgi:hypothetical protein